MLVVRRYPYCIVLILFVLLASQFVTPTPFAQTRLMEVDSTLDNLVHLPGYTTTPFGELGDWHKAGSGSKTMLLIPGAGFGADIFDAFAERWGAEYTLYKVTVAGFGGTGAPPMPPAGTSFGEQTWTNSALAGIRQLIAREGLHNITVVGHWLIGTQLALRLALDEPDLVDAVVIVGGSARFMSPDTTRMPNPTSLAQRVQVIDQFMVPRWFQHVTRATWDDNNFLPQDYCINAIRQLQLWRKAAEPTLPVWVRYLNEFYAQDVYLDLPKLTVPVLIVQPGFDDDCYADSPGLTYMRSYCRASWDGAERQNALVRSVTVNDARLFIMDDQPDKLDQVIKDFLKSL